MKRLLLLFLTCLFMSPLFVTSCERTMQVHGYSHEISRSFLDVANTHKSEFSNEENRIFSEAMNRLCLYVKDGKLVTDVISCEDINISQRLYDYMLAVIDYSNDILAGDPINTKSVDSSDYPYSCVAYALSHCIGGYSFDEINTWITDRYNMDGGVPPTSLGEVLVNFWGTDFCYYDHGQNIPDDIEWNTRRSVLVYQTDEGPAHMVNIIGRLEMSGYYTVRDYSQDSVNQRYTVPPTRVLGIYHTFAIDSMAVEDGIVDCL